MTEGIKPDYIELFRILRVRYAPSVTGPPMDGPVTAELRWNCHWQFVYFDSLRGAPPLAGEPLRLETIALQTWWPLSPQAPCRCASR